MAGAWTTVSVKDAGGTSRTMRAWDESGTGAGPFSLASTIADLTGAGSVVIKAASTAAAAGDESLVTNESPNSQLSVATGTTADAAWSGTGNSSIVAALKAIWSAIVNPPTAGSASGGFSVKTAPALSNTAVAVKASAGQIYKVMASNADTTHWAYIQVFDKAAASVVVGTDAPLDFFAIPPGTVDGFVFSLVGIQCSTAISVAATSTATGGTAPTTAVDCSVGYK